MFRYSHIEYAGKVWALEAKVYNEPSPFGVNDGRVSKLYIYDTSIEDTNKALTYQYERGWDTDEPPEELLTLALAEFEHV